MKRVAVVGHADADGHVIAEQVRRNLAAVPSFDLSLVVDPARTRDHHAWLHLDSMSEEIDGCDMVFFVDMMFAPTSFAEEASALVTFAEQRPSTLFFLIDHHPLPLRRLTQTRNLRALYSPDVLDCTFGHVSFLMLVAALLESQPTRAHKLKRPAHILLAKGIHRAAAPGGPLPGEKLMALLRNDRWAELEELGRDDPSFHRLPRGRRPKGSPISDILQRLDLLATELLRDPQPTEPREFMAYDFDTLTESPTGFEAIVHSPRQDPKDLESIVLVLELAALRLTPHPEATFTTAELLNCARELAGESFRIDESDIKIVLGKAGFLKRMGGRLQLK